MQGANPCPQFFVKFKPYMGRDSRLYARVVEQADTAVSKTVILWVQIPPFAPIKVELNTALPCFSERVCKPPSSEKGFNERERSQYTKGRILASFLFGGSPVRSLMVCRAPCKGFLI